MFPLRTSSIERKLRLMIVATSGIVLLLVAGIFFVAALTWFRGEVQRGLSTQAGVISYVSVTPLDFDDQSGAQEIINSLQASPDLLAGAVYRTNDTVFASYVRPAARQGIPTQAPPPGFNARSFEFTSEVLNPDGQKVGTIYLKADVATERRFLWQCVLIMASSLVLAALFAAWLAARFQRIITVPVHRLLHVMKNVSDQKDYTLRAETRSTDEIGQLVHGFNEMLGHLQTRDEELRRQHNSLEEQVAARTVELRQANQQLAAAKALADGASAAKSQFLANMSHELRTPLNAIIGYSEMLQEIAQEDGHADYVPDLEKIHAAARHQLGLINDILDLSKIEAGKMTLFLETFDVSRLMEEVAATVQPLVAKNGNTLEVHPAPDLGLMRADVTKVRQTLFNLLSNASKFTERGTIHLRVSRTPAAEPTIQFTVTDTGIGMSPDQIGRLFQPFTQADASTTRKYGGTGLGLTISRQFCQLMGGDLTATSMPGQGSTFTVTLPVQVREQSTAPPPEPVPAPSQPPTRSSTAALPWSGTVLVIDDDPSVRDLLARALVRDGYRVELAENGPRGLELARQLHPAVITLDVMMPGTDGWAVLTALKADPDTADIPVVMLTIVDEKNLGFALGAADYLTKPVDFSRLSTVLRRHCRLDSPHRVLVVEDDIPTRDLLVRQLSREGWATETAANGREGLERVRAGTPGLILLDLMMPVMDGFDFLAALRRQPGCQHVPVVIITAKSLTDADRQRLNGEVARILQKGSTSREQLVAEVRSLLVNPV